MDRNEGKRKKTEGRKEIRKEERTCIERKEREKGKVEGKRDRKKE